MACLGDIENPGRKLRAFECALKAFRTKKEKPFCCCSCQIENTNTPSPLLWAYIAVNWQSFSKTTKTDMSKWFKWLEWQPRRSGIKDFCICKPRSHASAPKQIELCYNTVKSRELIALLFAFVYTRRKLLMAKKANRGALTDVLKNGKLPVTLCGALARQKTGTKT